MSVVADATLPAGQNLKIYVDGVLAAQGGTVPTAGNYGSSASSFQMAGDGLVNMGDSNGSFFVGRRRRGGDLPVCLDAGPRGHPRRPSHGEQHCQQQGRPRQRRQRFRDAGHRLGLHSRPRAWTFGVGSDDGYGLWLTNGSSTLTASSTGTKTASSDNLTTFNVPYAGWWDTKLVYFQRTGGSQLEFYAAQGSYASWAAGGTSWALVGDTAHGGLQAVSGGGWTTTIYKALNNQTVTTLAQADGYAAGTTTPMWSRTDHPQYINYLTSGTDGNFSAGAAAPANVASRMVPGANEYTFGVNSDEGFSLSLSNTQSGGAPTSPASFSYNGLRTAADTFQTFTFPGPGLYNLRLVTFNRTGTYEAEMFAAPGTVTTYDANAFRLVGDTADGGLAAYIPGHAQMSNITVAQTMIATSSWQQSHAASSSTVVNEHLTGSPAGHYTDTSYPAIKKRHASGPGRGGRGQRLRRGRQDEPGDSGVLWHHERAACGVPDRRLRGQLHGDNHDSGRRGVHLRRHHRLRLPAHGRRGHVRQREQRFPGTERGGQRFDHQPRDRHAGQHVGVVNFAAAGTYTLQLEWFNHSGPSMIELYSAAAHCPLGATASPGCWSATR